MQEPKQYTGEVITELMATVDNLIYASYKANRLRSPEVSPERWALIYLVDCPAMEQRFQREFPQGAEA